MSTVQLLVCCTSGCVAVHRLLTVHHLVRVSVSLTVTFKVRVRDIVKLKFMDHS